MEVDLAPVKDLVTCVQQQASKSRQQDEHVESRQTDSETEDTVLSFRCVDHTFEVDRKYSHFWFETSNIFVCVCF